MRKALLSVAMFCLVTAAFAQNVNTVILFESNAVEIKRSSSDKLDNLIATTRPGDKVVFEMMGVVSKNYGAEELSNIALNRANALVDVLKKNGIPESNLKIQSQEMIQPTICTEPYTVYMVQMIMPGSIISEPLLATTEPEKKMDLSDYVIKNTQTFTVDPKKNIVVKGEEGTVVTFPAYSFVFPNGAPVAGEVEIELEEFYSSSDLLAHGLTTMSDGQLIESGGTIYVNASSGGQRVQMAAGTEFIMEFNSDAAKLDGMQTFMGSRQSDGTMNWTPAAAPEMTSVLDNVAQNEQDGVFGKITANNMYYNNINAQNVNWNQYNINNRGGYYDSFYMDTTAMTPEQLEEYRVQMAEYEEQMEYQNKINKMDSYMLTSSELGWINCDRFRDVVAEEKTNLIVEVAGDNQAAVRLVFSDIKCVMNGYGTNESTAFNSIPIGQKATVVAYYMVDDEPFYAMEEVTISPDGKVRIDPKAATETELKSALASLDT